MKTILVAFLLPAVAAFASPAFALDVPPGGDALLHQVRSSQIAAVGVLVSAGKNTLSFKDVQSLDGQVPATLEVSADDYVQTLKLVPGKSYALFLNPPGGKALPGARRPFDTAVSMYSIVETAPAEVGEYKQAVSVMRKARADKAAARTPLLKTLGESKVPYLQYSAAQALRQLNVLQKDDLPVMRRALENPQMDPRAQEQVVRELMRIDPGDQSKLLEQLIKSPKTSVAVKSLAVDGLFRQKGPEGLKPVLDDIDKAQSPRLKKQVGGLLSKQKPPSDEQ